MAFSKDKISWLAYDPAASAYALIVRTVIAPVFLEYFARNILTDSQITSRWSLVASAAGIVAGIITVFSGPIVDARRKKVQMLALFTAMGVLSSLAYLIPALQTPGYILAISFCGIMSFMASNSFYDSLLISITTPAERDRFSSLGNALGYSGGLCSFLLCMGLRLFDGISIEWFFCGSFIIAALWWGCGSLPLLCNVKEPTPEKQTEKIRIKETVKFILSQKNILLFLIAYFLYIDGVGTILLAATPLAAGLNISTDMIIVTILLLQLIGLPATLLYGKFAEKFSAKNMVKAAIIVYITIAVTVTVMAFCKNLAVKQTLFFLTAFLVGSSQGGIQSLSRSIFSKIIPQERSAELFSVYNIFGKFTTIVGPVLIAFATLFWDKAELGISMLILPFILGFILLSKVKVPEN
ncbi:MAG: MFS transporter [Lentisphaeria bacterium]|nr:MFS transporter [Lentisphaeria bacterium]